MAAKVTLFDGASPVSAAAAGFAAACTPAKAGDQLGAVAIQNARRATGPRPSPGCVRFDQIAALPRRRKAGAADATTGDRALSWAPALARARPAETGMTLIEMLIVLTIIAVAAGAVTLGIGAATRAPSVGSEAQRLADRLQSAADDAMLGDALVAFTAEKTGYGFARFDGATWQPVGGDALGFHALPAGMTMRLSASPPIVLGPEGSGKPMIATLNAEGQAATISYDGLTARVTPAT
jgi:general secretion pathway protein H